MKKIAVILLSIVWVVSLFGCGSGSDDTTEDTSDASGSKYALFLASDPNETTMSIRDQAIATAEEMGIELTVFIGQDDQATQVGQIETCITQGYDGLIIEPISGKGCNEVMKTAQDAGIAMVTVMQDCSNASLVSAHIGADHEAAAGLQMQLV